MQSPSLGERFDRALAWASELHRDQVRKGSGAPYISHLLAVAAIAIEHGADEDEAIAALLHDAIEDQGVAYGGADKLRRAIEERFGARVLAIVEGCTDTDVVPKPPWKERKVAYLEHLKKADPSVLLVSCADKLHNVRSTMADLLSTQDHEAYWKQFNGGQKGSLWNYRSLAEIYLEKLRAPISEELARAVLELTSLAGGSNKNS